MIIHVDPNRFVSAIEFPSLSANPQVTGTNTLTPINFQNLCGRVSSLDTVMSFHLDPPRALSFVQLNSEKYLESSQIKVTYLEPCNQWEVKEILKKQSAIFVGLARDCQGTVRPNLDIISILSSFFEEVKILLIENDSSDLTRDVIQSWAATTPLNVILPTFTGLDVKISKRTERLAFLRNYALQLLRDGDMKPDYVIMMDLDGMIAKQVNDFSFEGFLSNFSYTNLWDAVFPSPQTYYYDIWAFRHPFICPEDYRLTSKSGPALLGQDRIVGLTALSRQIVMKSLGGWLEVDSAFGAMGIYRGSAILNSDCEYIGIDSEGEETCEHVSLHSSIRQSGGYLYINPKFQVLGDDTASRAAQLQMLLGI